MPRTADSATDDQALGEGPVIMRAMWRDGEDFLTRPHQENLLVANMTDERSLIRQVSEGYATGEIGAGRIRFVAIVSSSPSRASLSVWSSLTQKEGDHSIGEGLAIRSGENERLRQCTAYSGSNSFCRRRRARKSRVFTV